ncbi:alpha/beta hydrolase [Actibacterium ureilyticum]|uniref:alpha/beta hydrolase n=1 Tax=Actibacterium ureilyticum TaxID=1590614 RepID=UPI001140A9BE|nr:alpha/beta hydrolase [Actibacterium ureilyticum]
MTRIVFAFLLLLTACGPRPDVTVMPEAAQVGRVVPVFYSTTRAQDPDGVFRGRRSAVPGYGKVAVSVPPEHRTGRLELNGRRPDPQKHFVTVSADQYPDRAAFRAALARALRDNPQAKREVALFVHGYNNTFGEGVYREAQLVHDFQIPSIVVHYAWPSAAHPLGYAYDSDSALFARDGLEMLIHDVNAAGAETVILMAHSMGTNLGMEVMRQMAIRKPGDVSRLIDAVFLISPDIDVDVFRSQVAPIRKLPSPFVIFSSDRDRALKLSSRINGNRNRLGNLASADLVADLPLTMIDVTQFGGNRDLGHFTLGSSPTLIMLVRNLPAVEQTFRLDRSGQSGLVPGTILTVQNATQIILSPAEAVLSR